MLMLEKMESGATPRSMGRPPLGLARTTIHLPKRIGVRIAAVLRDREKQAAFIREAIEHEIQRREAEKKKRPK